MHTRDLWGVQHTINVSCMHAVDHSRARPKTHAPRYRARACIHAVRRESKSTVHNMMQRSALHCVVLAFEFAATQWNTRIDSDPILAFLCVASLCLVTKNHEFVNIFTLRKLDAMQRMRPCIILWTSLNRYSVRVCYPQRARARSWWGLPLGMSDLKASVIKFWGPWVPIFITILGTLPWI